jgi:histidinol-phosphatase (PHP family)
MLMTLTNTQQVEENIALNNNYVSTKNTAKSMLMDYHVHDYRSRDAPFAKIEDYVSEATKKGVSEIAFTTHLIISGSDSSTSIKLHEIEDYLSDIWKIRENSNITLKTGFEVDYVPEDERIISKILEEFDLDFVLGSVHNVNGLNIAVEENLGHFFKKKKTSETLDEYYGLWKRAIESGLFDVMSHPDYFRKVVNGEIFWNNYGEVVYDAIDALKQHGIGFEINTSGYRHGIGDKFPRDEFIQTAIAAGVKTITLGSDSHMTSTIGFRLKEAAKRLDYLGLKQVSRFTRRREEKTSIKKY